jgi:hypothetical protein
MVENWGGAGSGRWGGGGRGGGGWKLINLPAVHEGMVEDVNLTILYTSSRARDIPAFFHCWKKWKVLNSHLKKIFIPLGGKLNVPCTIGKRTALHC